MKIYSEAYLNSPPVRPVLTIYRNVVGIVISKKLPLYTTLAT